MTDMPASVDERYLRRLLAVRVAIPHTYYDDGEAQGQQHGITIDFMREPVADIDAKLRALNVARADKALVQSQLRRVGWIDPTEHAFTKGPMPDDTDWKEVYVRT